MPEATGTASRMTQGEEWGHIYGPVFVKDMAVWRRGSALETRLS